MFNSFYFDNYELISTEPEPAPSEPTEGEGIARPQSDRFFHADFMRTPEKFLALYQELNFDAKTVARGSNYVIKNVNGAQVRLRYMWDIDTGEIYKHQILVPAGADIIMVFEYSTLDNDVVIAYTENERMYYGA